MLFLVPLFLFFISSDETFWCGFHWITIYSRPAQINADKPEVTHVVLLVTSFRNGVFQA
jgi:hypothetical protein